MNYRNFKLLLPLWYLLKRKNVTDAAHDLNLSQPAMSRILEQLRGDFNDPLLVRCGRELSLTSRAMNLLEKLDQFVPGLLNIEQLEDLDVTEFDGTINIAGMDLDFILYSDCIAEIMQRASNLNVSLNTLPPGTEQFDRLVSGQLDFVFLPQETNRPGLYRASLFNSEFVCIVSQHSKVDSSSFCLEAYLRHDHGGLVRGKRFKSLIDSALGGAMSKRNIVLEVPCFSVMPAILNSTDLIFTVPSMYAEYAVKHFPIRVLPLPFEPPTMEVFLYWHERQHNSVIHRWVRNQFISFFRKQQSSVVRD